MEEVFTIVVILCVFILAVFGVTLLAGDYRLFDNIVKQCETQGYIQNQTIRLTCTKEVKDGKDAR